MENRSERDYNVLLHYVEQGILNGSLVLGDRLPPERELAQTLEISRSSVREGLRILEVIGVIYSLQGSGNYIANYYDETLTKIMTMMFALEKMSDEELRDYRYAIEQQALVLAVSKITERGKLKLLRCLREMEESEDPAARTESDKLLHKTLVEASGNRLVISNYHALNSVLSRQISNVRARVELRSADEGRRFRKAHRDLVEAVCAGNLEAANKALNAHYVFIMDDLDT